MPRVAIRKPLWEIDDEADLDVVDGVEYPSSDGKPMAETEIHASTIILLYQILRHHYYKDRTDVHVVANIMLYWEQGNSKASGSPDVMVSFGVSGIHPRRSFLCWKEGVVPAVALEIASRGTWRKRLGKSKDDYERAGIKEYFIFDPDKKYIAEHLLGFRLKGKRYVRIARNKDGTMLSREMNLLLVPHGRDLRVADAVTGAWLLTEAEEASRRADEQKAHAQNEKRRAEEESRRAEDEKRRADSLQEEVERLRALLQDRNGRPNGKTNGAHHS